MSIADQAETALQCINRGEYQQAAQLFAQAVAASPSSNLWNDLGYAQLACGRVPEAERSFRQALAIAPDNPQAAINLGALLANTGKTEAAVQWLERGVSAVDQTQRAAVLDLLANCKNQKQRPLRSATKPRARDISKSQ
jgi:Flp pilus assembly protein TadD